MSKPDQIGNLFPNPDPSGDFGRNEGLASYSFLADLAPDRPVEKIAELAVRIRMIVHRQYDINPQRATEALVGVLDDEILGGSKK